MLRTGYEILVFASTALFFFYLGRGIQHTFLKFRDNKRGGPDHLCFLSSICFAVLCWAQVVIHHDGSKSPSLITLNVGGSLMLLILCCCYSDWNIGGLKGRVVSASMCIIYAFVMCTGYLIHQQWVWFKYFVFPTFLFGSYHGLYNACAALKYSQPARADTTGLYILTVVCIMLQPLFFWEVKENTFMIPIIAIGVHNIIGIVMAQFAQVAQNNIESEKEKQKEMEAKRLKGHRKGGKHKGEISDSPSEELGESESNSEPQSDSAANDESESGTDQGDQKRWHKKKGARSSEDATNSDDDDDEDDDEEEDDDEDEDEEEESESSDQAPPKKKGRGGRK